MQSSQSQKLFGQVPNVQIPRSKFTRDRTLLTSFDMDYIIPIYWDEIYPGDSVKMDVNCFARLNTPLVPIMDNIYLDTFAFFIPNRLVWDNWVKMMGETVDPGDSTDYTVPQMDIGAAPINTTGYTVGSLADYLGVVTDSTDVNYINAMPFRAYNLIWNEWFRHIQLQEAVTVDTADADSDPADYVLLKRCKRPDYFCSALPDAQLNNTGTAVTMPLGTSADVCIDAVDNGNIGVYSTVASATKAMDTAGGAGDQVLLDTGTPATNGMYADLTNATAATINEFREAIATQRLYERDSRGGNRYQSLIRSHYGVTGKDARFQRPEYITGGRFNININSIANTSPIKAADAPQAADINQGDLSAFALGQGSCSFFQSFDEHGILMILANANCPQTYQEGMDKKWLRQDRLDYMFPALCHLGEQAITREEIYLDGSPSTVFGYIPRYDELRYGKNQITGAFRSTYATSLDQWHLAQELGGAPTLNSAFIQMNSPIDRCIAVSTEHHLKMSCYFKEEWVRCMPTFAVPGMVDHF